MVALGLSLLLVACGQSPAPAKTEPKAAPAASQPTTPASAQAPAKSAPAPVKVAAGVIGQLSDAGIYIALAKGYFKEQALEVETPTFNAAPEMLPAAATDRIQVTRSAQSAGLFNSMANNIDMKIVADGASMPKGFGYLAIIVRKDLVDSGAVKAPKDLKGRSVAVAAKGGTSDIALERVLKRDGLTLKDVDLKALGFPEQLAALANKALDAAVIIEPTLSAALEQKLAVKMWSGDDAYPNMQTGLLVFSPNFAKNRDAAERFMVAYLKGVRDYNDAFGPQKKGYDDIVGVLTKRTRITDRTMYAKMVPVGLHPDGKVNMSGLAEDLKWYKEGGLVKNPPDLAKAVDMSFADAAAKKLGPYTR